jgi:hypothetical protein
VVQLNPIFQINKYIMRGGQTTPRYGQREVAEPPRRARGGHPLVSRFCFLFLLSVSLLLGGTLTTFK